MEDTTKQEAEVRKILAEAAKMEAEAAKVAAEAQATVIEGDANACRLRAEAERLKAETVSLNYESDQEKIKLEIAQIDHKNKLQEQFEKEAKNEFHNIHYFREEVSSSTVGDCIRTIDVWRRVGAARGLESKQIPIDIIFSSPGGSVIDGLRLFDYLQECRRAGHKVSTGTYGYAASMAGILLQAGDVRWMGKEAWVLIHQISAISLGKIPEMEDTIKWLNRIQDRVINIFVERAMAVDGCPMNEPGVAKQEKFPTKEAAREYFKSRWERKDWWLSSDDCKTLGIVDEVR